MTFKAIYHDYGREEFEYDEYGFISIHFSVNGREHVLIDYSNVEEHKVIMICNPGQKRVSKSFDIHGQLTHSNALEYEQGTSEAAGTLYDMLPGCNYERKFEALKLVSVTCKRNGVEEFEKRFDHNQRLTTLIRGDQTTHYSYFENG